MPNSSEKAILKVVDKVKTTGKFVASGHARFQIPGLELPEFGEIGFPLSPWVAEAILEDMEESRFGVGEDTLYDPEVRRCHELDKSELSFRNEKWQQLVVEIAKDAATGLGLNDVLVPHMHKLLLYEEGDFFAPHQDSEKLDAMVATLVICLPAKHCGGELYVRHLGEELVVDFADPEAIDYIQWTAFYANCEHEVKIVKSGFRMCLIYNLQLSKSFDGLNEGLDHHIEELVPLLKKMPASQGLKAFLLDHQYSEVGFAKQDWKGVDASKSRVLAEAAQRAGYVAHFGLIELHRMGELVDEYATDDPEAIGEIYEEELYISSWKSAGSHAAPNSSFAINFDQLISPHPIDADDPIEHIGEGWTGNAGCTMDLWYRRAAVIIWPQDQDLQIRMRHDFEGALDNLLKRAANQKHQTKRIEIYGQEAEKFQIEWQRLSSETTSSEFRKSRFLMTQLCVMFDYELWDDLREDENYLNAFLALNTKGKAIWLDSCDDVLALVASWLEEGSDEQMFAHIIIMIEQFAEQPLTTAKIRSYWLGRLPDVLAKLMDLRNYYNSEIKERAITTALEISQHLDDASLRNLSNVLGGGEDIDILRLYVNRFFATEKSRESVLGKQLLNKAIAFLTKYTAEPPQPYSDWSRPWPAGLKISPVSYYREVTDVQKIWEEFMADPDREVCEITIGSGNQKSLDYKINSSGLDIFLTMPMQQGGRPVTFCTKTNGSYKRAVKQHKDDVKLLKKLRKV